MSIKKRISFKTNSPNGIEIIKNLLGNIKEAEVKYISAGNYSIKSEADNIKKADQIIQEIAKNIEKEAQKNNATFVIN